MKKTLIPFGNNVSKKTLQVKIKNLNFAGGNFPKGDVGVWSTVALWATYRFFPELKLDFPQKVKKIWITFW